MIDITPIDEQPLHMPGLEGDHWACSTPERPFDYMTNYDYRCRSCWLHAKATLYNGDDPMAARRGGEVVFMSQMVEATAHLHEGPPWRAVPIMENQ